MSKYLKKVRESPILLSRKRALQAEGTSAEALRWTREAHTQGDSRKARVEVKKWAGNDIREIRGGGGHRGCRTWQTIVKAAAFTLREMSSHWRILSSGNDVFCL